jgi:hypothetical protein
VIEACEAIEQSEIAGERPSREESSQSHRNIERSADKNSTQPQKQKKKKVMVNTTAVNMGITLHTLQQTATQLKIGQKPRITPQGPTNAVFSTRISAERSTC